MAVFWYSGPALTGELGPLYLICWETNGDLDSALGERTRMWFSALALDHRSRCALWSQILGVCVGREYVVLWTGQTLSGDQLTLEFISFEKRSNSPCSSFSNCPFWRESRENHCIWMGKIRGCAVWQMESKSQKVRLQGEVKCISVDLSRCGRYRGTGLFLCFHWHSHKQLKFKTRQFWRWFTDRSQASFIACRVLSQ